MPWLRRLSSKTAVAATLLLAAALLTTGGWTLYQAARDAENSTAWVEQSREVLDTLGIFRESFAEFSAAQRGYLLTGEDNFVRERDGAMETAEAALVRLELLVADHAAQSARVHQLREALAERAAAARAAGERRRVEQAFGPTPTPDALRVRSSSALRRVLTVTTAFDREEHMLLAQRRQVAAERERHASIAVGASFSACVAIVLLLCAALYLEARRRRSSELQMTEIVENLPVTVWQMVTRQSRERRFVYVSADAERNRGVSAEELLADPGVAMRNVVEEDRPAVRQAIWAAGEEQAPLDIRYRVLLPGGEVRWVHNRARVRRRSDGSQLWTGYWADISTQTRLEQDLRQATLAAEAASRAKSNFLATMSHEIRTPLHGVLGLLELLGLTALDAQQRATLVVVQKSGRSLLRIIDDILDLSKVESGRLELRRSIASLREVIQGTCDVHRGTASGRGLLLQHAVDPRISPLLEFDALRVAQILNNFISNALKFTREGSVTVTAELQRVEDGVEWVRITVADTGIGVSPEAAMRLFEPFVQAEAGTWAEYGGTGLGLAISRRLAILMGGDVQMHSVPGEGTRMVLDLPAPQAPATAWPEDPSREQERLADTVTVRRAPPTLEEAEAAGTLVLMADDHPTNRMVLERQLHALGYATLAVEDGEAALDAWRTRRVGLLLTDCNMPRLSGYALAAAIRAEEAARGLPRTPILGSTAGALDTEAQRCASAGMDGCLVKPVSLTRLMEAMDCWLPLGPPPAGGDEAIDLPELHDAMQDPEVMRGFAATQAADLAELTQAVAARDYAGVRRLVHRMLGAAQMLGADALMDACRALGEAADIEDGPTLDADLPEVQRHSEALQAVAGARANR